MPALVLLATDKPQLKSKEPKMNTIEAIKTRRSIRKYTEQSVAPEIIKELLAAAMSAPSAGNQQPWCFVVMDDRSLLNQVPSFSPYAGMCRESPVSILVCGDTRSEKHPGFWIQDCAAATQNLLLAAHEKGLGAVWTGVYPREERVKGFRELLHLPEGVIPLAFIVIGHPAQQPFSQDRFQEDRIHHNGW
jgi:nitroreductase